MPVTPRAAAAMIVPQGVSAGTGIGGGDEKPRPAIARPDRDRVNAAAYAKIFISSFRK